MSAAPIPAYSSPARGPPDVVHRRCFQDGIEHGIEQPTDNDVLCGRGVTTNRHVGNENFRSLVNCNKELYVTSSKREKMTISRSIVDAVRTLNPPGRFLEKNVQSGLWFEIGDKKAIEKTSQALRDGAANLRKQLAEDLNDPELFNDVFDADKEKKALPNKNSNSSTGNSPPKTKSASSPKKGHNRSKSADSSPSKGTSKKSKSSAVPVSPSTSDIIQSSQSFAETSSTLNTSTSSSGELPPTSPPSTQPHSMPTSPDAYYRGRSFTSAASAFSGPAGGGPTRFRHGRYKFDRDRTIISQSRSFDHSSSSSSSSPAPSYPYPPHPHSAGGPHHPHHHPGSSYHRSATWSSGPPPPPPPAESRSDNPSEEPGSPLTPGVHRLTPAGWHTAPSSAPAGGHRPPPSGAWTTSPKWPSHYRQRHHKTTSPHPYYPPADSRAMALSPEHRRPGSVPPGPHPHHHHARHPPGPPASYHSNSDLAVPSLATDHKRRPVSPPTHHGGAPPHPGDPRYYHHHGGGHPGHGHYPYHHSHSMPNPSSHQQPYPHPPPHHHHHSSYGEYHGPPGPPRPHSTGDFVPPHSHTPTRNRHRSHPQRVLSASASGMLSSLDGGRHGIEKEDNHDRGDSIKREEKDSSSKHESDKEKSYKDDSSPEIDDFQNIDLDESLSGIPVDESIEVVLDQDMQECVRPTSPVISGDRSEKVKSRESPSSPEVVNTPTRKGGVRTPPPVKKEVEGGRPGPLDPGLSPIFDPADDDPNQPMSISPITTQCFDPCYALQDLPANILSLPITPCHPRDVGNSP